jgi:hypothetical protein
MPNAAPMRNAGKTRNVVSAGVIEADDRMLVMQLSAEIRWFSNRRPEELARWFCAPIPVSYAPEVRQDRYFVDATQSEVGMKLRGAKSGVEIKGLVARVEQLKVAPFMGRIEIWTKWKSQALVLDSSRLVTIAKTRWLRKFDTSENRPVESRDDSLADGCGVELTKIDLAGGVEWWTFGFEAFGPLDRVGASLRRTAELLAGQGAPDLEMELTASYPEWLKHVGA